jgi:general stress protein 26
MKTHAQPNAASSQLCDMVKDLSVAMLTTLNPDGELVSRPMSALEMDDDGAFWFFTDAKSGKVEQLERLNLSFCSTSKGTYVSISGSGEIVVDQARNEALWTAFARPWFPEGAKSADLVLIKVTPDAAEYWDAPGSKMVGLFAMAVSAVAGKPIGLGEHEKLDLTEERASLTSPL